MTRTLTCLLCGGRTTTDELCDTCRWLVAVEVHNCLRQIERYLGHWARFRAWEETQRSESAA